MKHYQFIQKIGLKTNIILQCIDKMLHVSHMIIEFLIKLTTYIDAFATFTEATSPTVPFNRSDLFHSGLSFRADATATVTIIVD